MASSNRTKVFISYSHKDVKYLNELLPYLKYLEKNKLIDLWSDSKINPGDKWKEEIASALASTKIAILLISIDFLNSPFIGDNELPPLLTAAESEGVKILPVILRPCSLPKNLSQFQAINSLSRPLAKMKKYEREELWTKVTETIREFIIAPGASQDIEQELRLKYLFLPTSLGKDAISAENNITNSAQSQPTPFPHFEDRVLYHLVALTGEHHPLPLGSGVSEADLAKCLANELGISSDFPHDPQFHTSDARSTVLAAVTTLEQEGLLEAMKVFGPWTIRPTLAGRLAVERRNATWRKKPQAQHVPTGDSPDFKILTSPVFQTNSQNWIDVNAHEQRIEIKNIGRENAYHIYATLFGCETYIVPNTLPQKRVDLNGFYWREYSGCPLEPGDTLTLTLMRYRDELDGKQELGGYQLCAPQEPGLYDATHHPSLPFHSARLTLTYRDRFENKYAQTFDYDHHKKAWVYLAHPRVITGDFLDLLSSKEKKSISNVNKNQGDEPRNVLYQLFFAELLERLRNVRPGITNAKKAQPQNFYFFGAGKTGYSFNWAFTKNGIKTELIINIPNNRSATKKAFDTLYGEQATIEKELDQSLFWDRLEGKESHIFLMRPATIDDPEEELEQTKKWAVETMIKFVDVFKKRIKRL